MSVVTNKRLLVRLEAPRFFVERDTVTLSAIVRNDLATDKSVRVTLATVGPLSPAASRRPSPAQGRGLGLGGDTPLLTLSPARNERVRERLASLGEPGEGATPGEGLPAAQTIIVPAHSEKRVDWTESVTGDGEANVKMSAETDEESDAVSQTFPVLTYGVQKFVAQSGVMQAGQTQAKLTINIPAEHKSGSAALLIQINPSLAATALDALPYLADYPYGCVEQTLSRFLPSVLVAKTLREVGRGFGHPAQASISDAGARAGGKSIRAGAADDGGERPDRIHLPDRNAGGDEDRSNGRDTMAHRPLGQPRV